MICVGFSRGHGELYLMGSPNASREAFPNLPVTDSQKLDEAIPGVVGRAVESEVISLEWESSTLTDQRQARVGE